MRSFGPITDAQRSWIREYFQNIQKYPLMFGPTKDMLISIIWPYMTVYGVDEEKIRNLAIRFTKNGCAGQEETTDEWAQKILSVAISLLDEKDLQSKEAMKKESIHEAPADSKPSKATIEFHKDGTRSFYIDGRLVSAQDYLDWIKENSK